MRYPGSRLALFLFIFLFAQRSFAQIGTITFDLQKDKPKKFQNKTLKSEKTGDEKFTVPRKLIQNTVTHYNYFFNANNKLNAVIENARISNKENYSKLLPFYGYSLNTTAAQKTELDSVIYKATAGILLHDLRNSWVDNLYLLIGKAYYFEKEFDSASMTFQFINYNLYPHKKNEDEFLIVGTGANRANGELSIANKENRTLLNKAFSLPPSRNDALVWQIRTLIESGSYPEAAGLINTLHNDANFPSRLSADLEEVNAYWFYKQSIFDSAANHLEKALSAAEDKQDRARWEYLLAQLFEMTKQYEKASVYYRKAMIHTTDPLLDIYANLNNAKMYSGNDPAEIDNSISNLVKMSKKGKFENYREIVFYSAGELALEKKDTNMAEYFFKKSLQHIIDNSPYRSRDYLQLADISFAQRKYKSAAAYYDSIQFNDEILIGRSQQVTERKAALLKIVEKINIIEREDSLQKISFLSPADRDAFIKNLLKQLRKAKGLKEEDQVTPSSVFNNTTNTSPDLFGANDTKGDWYFYNAAIKSRGYTEFKSRWGNRQNVDNWRRLSAVTSAINNTVINNNNNPAQNVTTQPNTATELSFEGLMNNLPLTPEKLLASNAMISSALFELGKLYQNELEDYRIAAETYETSLQRFPDKLYGGEIYLNLYYCYQKLGETAKAANYKNLLLNRFGGSKYAEFITNPKAITNVTVDPAATKRYENIYNLFIEGKFDEAVQEKKITDSVFGHTYWTPQLLYIEAVYYIRQRQDSTAINILNQIIFTYPSSGLLDKASTMIDVLGRRKQIEAYLTNLNVTKAKEDSIVVVNDQKPLQQQKPVEKPVVQTPTPESPKPVVVGSFSFIAEAPHNVIMVLDKVDPVYISEARNALNRYNREKYPGQTIEIVKEVIDNNKSVLVFRQFPDANAAITYSDRLKKNVAGEISWLPANKYSFLIISEANLEVLKGNKDLQGYIKLLNTKYPGKF